MCETYNGWSNRETWACSLHINNDEGLQNDFSERIEQEWDAAIADLTRTSTEGEIRDAKSEALYKCREAAQEFIDELFTVQGYEDNFGEPQPKSIRLAVEDIGSLCRVDVSELCDGVLEDKLTEFEMAHSSDALKRIALIVQVDGEELTDGECLEEVWTILTEAGLIPSDRVRGDKDTK